MGNRMWALILRYGIPDADPGRDAPAAVLRLERREEPPDEVPVVATALPVLVEETVESLHNSRCSERGDPPPPFVWLMRT